MAQQAVKPWIVRAVSPQQKVEYYVVETNNPQDAKQRVQNWFAGQKREGWTIENPVEPTKRF